VERLTNNKSKSKKMRGYELNVEVLRVAEKSILQSSSTGGSCPQNGSQFFSDSYTDSYHRIIRIIIIYINNVYGYKK